MEQPQRPGERARRPTVYLASPGIFRLGKKVCSSSSLQREALGVDVYEPFSRAEQLGLGPSSGSKLWALDIAHTNIDQMKHVDAVFAVLNGSPPDEGVAVEVGVAIALGKPTFLFRDDCRNSADNNIFSCNLMLYAGLQRWIKRIFTTPSMKLVTPKALWVTLWSGK